MVAFYCYGCLDKPSKRLVNKTGVCVICGNTLRQVSNRKRRAQVVTRLSRQRGIKKPTKKSHYPQYLKSALWMEIRGRVLERDKNICQDCGREASQVHHMSYKPAVMAGENDSQLVSLCCGCHDKRHADKRKG